MTEPPLANQENSSGIDSETRSREVEETVSAKVSALENFFDIIVAVAIHAAADHTENGTWPWYMLRVYWVFDLWNRSVTLANVVHLLNDNAHSPYHYMMAFGAMGVWILLVQACQNDDHATASAIACAGHFTVNYLIIREANVPRPKWIAPERYERLKVLTRIGYVGNFVACAPVTLALVLGSEDDSVLLGANLLKVLFTVYFRHTIYDKYDALCNEAESLDGQVLDLDHVSERYEMIIFALLGELVAVTSDPASFYDCSLILVTAISCYLLYFAARVDGRIEGFRRSAVLTLMSQVFHLPLFYIIPNMGLAYVEVLRGGKEDENESYHDAQNILCYCGASFLVMMTAMEALTQDPTEPGKRARLPLWIRLSLNVAFAAVLVILCQFGYASTLVPVVLLTTALSQVWGVQICEKEHPKIE